MEASHRNQSVRVYSSIRFGTLFASALCRLRPIVHIMVDQLGCLLKCNYVKESTGVSAAVTSLLSVG
jgi:hypothetical protein